MTGLASGDMARLIGKSVHRRGLGFDAHALGVIVGPVTPSRSTPTVIDVQWRTGERTSCRREALELILSPTERTETMPPTKTTPKKTPARKSPTKTTTKASAKTPTRTQAPTPAETQPNRYYLKAETTVLNRVQELGLAKWQIAENLECSPSTVRNTLYVSQSPVAPQPDRMRRLSVLLGWKPGALQLLVEKGIMPELAGNAEVAEDIGVADEPKPTAAVAKRAKVVPEEALPAPTPPEPLVKPGGLRWSIIELQKENRALTAEVAELRAVLADVCGQLGVDGPTPQRSRKSA